MDIKAKIEELVKKITSDKELQAKFMKDPTGTVAGLTNGLLTKEQIDSAVDVIKAKLTADKVQGALGGLGGLFGKK